MRYVIMIEKAGRNYSAHAPDVPGCIAVGDTVEDVKEQMRQALEFHFEGLLRDGDELPAPAAAWCEVEVDFDRVRAAAAQPEPEPSVPSKKR